MIFTILLFTIFARCEITGVPDKMMLSLVPSNMAKCLDGSPPGFYFYPGTGSGTTKWMIFHEGGGWCTSINDCLSRSTTIFGSTKYRPLEVSIYSMDAQFSTDPSVNMLMYNWNKVFLVYCDGGSFSGNNNTRTLASQGDELFFRGRQNLIALKGAIDFLGMGKKSTTDVVISGCSAGGLATYLHLDWWRDNIPKSVKVVGLPVDGIFLDESVVGNSVFYDSMNWLSIQMNSSTNEKCMKDNTYKPGKCMFAEYISKYVSTPFFVYNSKYDEYDVGQSKLTINGFGTLFLQIFRATIMNTAFYRGSFINSCLQHCSKTTFIIGHLNSTNAFSLFYDGYLDAKVSHFIIEDKAYPCWECCGYPITFAGFLILLSFTAFLIVLCVLYCVYHHRRSHH